MEKEPRCTMKNILEPLNGFQGEAWFDMARIEFGDMYLDCVRKATDYTDLYGSSTDSLDKLSGQIASFLSADRFVNGCINN
jgi:hypothetical protein